MKKTEPTLDPGLAELRKDLPADGTPGNDIENSPIDLTVTKPSETPNADKPNPEKSASVTGRVSAVRAAIAKARGETVKEAAAPAVVPPAVVAPDTTKSAATGPLDLSQDSLVKLARVILSTDEGIAYATAAMSRADGEQAARTMIKEARAAADAHTQGEDLVMRAIEDTHTKSAAIYNELCGAINEEEADEILKTAALHEACLDEYESDPMLKQAYAEGMEDAAAMEGAAAEGAPPEVPMGGEQLTMDDIKMLLEELVASGQVSAEEVAQALAEIEGGGAGAEGGLPPEGGAPPPPVEEGAPPVA